jgi:hypothetical protein
VPRTTVARPSCIVKRVCACDGAEKSSSAAALQVIQIIKFIQAPASKTRRHCDSAVSGCAARAFELPWVAFGQAAIAYATVAGLTRSGGGRSRVRSPTRSKR